VASLLTGSLFVTECNGVLMIVELTGMHLKVVVYFTHMWPCIVTNFFLIKLTDAVISQIYFVKKLYMFRAVPLSIIRSYPLYVLCHQTCMTYSSVECTVENSWWWAEELPETCRVSWQNKFGKWLHLLVLLKNNCVYFSRNDSQLNRGGNVHSMLRNCC